MAKEGMVEGQQVDFAFLFFFGPVGFPIGAERSRLQQRRLLAGKAPIGSKGEAPRAVE